MTTLLLDQELAMKAPQGIADPRTDDVLTTLGHEIRNPLSALSHALDVWPSVQHDPAQLEELCRLMQRQVRQLTRLSNDLLDGPRSVRGELILLRECVPLRQLIDDACEQVQPFIDRCGHALSVMQPEESIMVDGDPSRLLQVFANLIQNATKFTACNGSIRVIVERLDYAVSVRVCDTGPGIEQHMLLSIFEKFAQVNGTRGPDNDGLGIGLSLVKAIVDLHGGSVTARSEGLGHGSEFTVLLPLLIDADHAHRSATQSFAACNSHGQRPPACRIVVADDDRSNRELLARLLRMIGQSVTVATDGEMAVRMVLDQRPQVVFLDLMMPGMDGCDVARQLRSHQELDRLIIVALSGNGDEESRRRALEAGFNKYLVKPIDFATLAKTLAELTSGMLASRP